LKRSLERFMSHASTGVARLPFRQGAAFLSLLLVAGCGDDSGVGKTYLVRGKVTLDGQPLVAANATVLFMPDASRGNTSPFEPAGNVDDDGNYTLLTKGKSGAPPGWYKVIVTALNEAPQHPKGSVRKRPVAHSLLSAKYGQAKTTDLSVEVVPNPAGDAYDLKLTSR
jgi:hypothetical protein